MIIGNGLIANAIQNIDRDDVIFLAAGVSNSLETNPLQFERERKLIEKQIIENKKLVYFSTCSVLDSSKKESLYVKHKLEMEDLIRSQSDNFLILRVSNAVGNGGNPHLLLNFLHRSILNNEAIEIHTNATRNLIDVEDLANITELILQNPQGNSTINIAYLKSFPIGEIVSTFERVLDKSAKKIYTEKGDSYDIEIPQIADYYFDKGKENHQLYLTNLITKYYS
ncbi:NAD-dependent epimerase/dehydratase family protein [Cruoricaptor ignavus]|uniref:NAD-dependent epimerase/dehydratase family protein n=1 Tax=Cruoricaptor ignavus TaxID=1118202 RepID=UPI00370D81D9